MYLFFKFFFSVKHVQLEHVGQSTTFLLELLFSQYAISIENETIKQSNIGLQTDKPHIHIHTGVHTHIHTHTDTHTHTHIQITYTQGTLIHIHHTHTTHWHTHGMLNAKQTLHKNIKNT